MRKSTIITLEDDGKNLTFKITQMSARQQERWQNRLIMLLTGADLNLDGLLKQLKKGEYEAILKLIGSIGYDKIEPLYDELLSCVAHVPDPNNPGFAVQLTPENVDTIVGEWQNLYKLRIAALKNNYSFFKGGEPSPNQKQADIKITKAM